MFYVLCFGNCVAVDRSFVNAYRRRCRPVPKRRSGKRSSVHLMTKGKYEYELKKTCRPDYCENSSWKSLKKCLENNFAHMARIHTWISLAGVTTTLPKSGADPLIADDDALRRVPVTEKKRNGVILSFSFHFFLDFLGKNFGKFFERKHNVTPFSIQKGCAVRTFIGTFRCRTCHYIYHTNLNIIWQSRLVIIGTWTKFIVADEPTSSGAKIRK